MIDVIVNPKFFVLENKYYLSNARYSNSKHIMISYHSVPYHLKKQDLARQKPKNINEFFNLHHTSLRNAVEWIFEVNKRRFKILIFALEYTFQT